jgi:hypothetical protein
MIKEDADKVFASQVGLKKDLEALIGRSNLIPFGLIILTQFVITVVFVFSGRFVPSKFDFNWFGPWTFIIWFFTGLISGVPWLLLVRGKRSVSVMWVCFYVPLSFVVLAFSFLVLAIAVGMDLGL